MNNQFHKNFKLLTLHNFMQHWEMNFVLYLESKQLEKEKSKEISNHMVIQVARDASIDRRRVSFHNKRKQQVVNGRREYRCHRRWTFFSHH